MAKFNLSKKTKLKRVLICLLFHEKNLSNLKILKNIAYNKNDHFLIIFDKIDCKVKLKKSKNITLLFENKKKNPVPFYRNLAIKYAKNKFEIIFFLDSDTLPSKNIIQKHYNAHKKYSSIPLIGGSVSPFFLIKYKSVWQVLDGVLSWFTSIEPLKDKLIKFPYHLPTCNLSIKNFYLQKYNLLFNTKVKTGEDVDLCNKFRSLNKKMMLIKDANIIHIDRISFKDFISHQIEWGRHHYYLRYKKKLVVKKNNFFLIIFFLFLYPLLIFILNFFMTYFTLKPWINKNFIYIFFFIPVFFVYFIKSIFTFTEFLKDLKNLL